MFVINIENLKKLKFFKLFFNYRENMKKYLKKKNQLKY